MKQKGHASEELRADRNAALAAVRQNGRALCCASEETRADAEVVLAAVKQDGAALRYASGAAERSRRHPPRAGGEDPAVEAGRERSSATSGCGGRPNGRRSTCG